MVLAPEPDIQSVWDSTQLLAGESHQESGRWKCQEPRGPEIEGSISPMRGKHLLCSPDSGENQPHPKATQISH